MPTQSHSIGETLPGRYYTDPTIFAEELERFFCQSWFCAGRADQIPAPGDFFIRQIANESIIVNRDQNGSVHAFYNVCRHRGTRICTVAEGNSLDASSALIMAGLTASTAGSWVRHTWSTFRAKTIL